MKRHTQVWLVSLQAAIWVVLMNGCDRAKSEIGERYVIDLAKQQVFPLGWEVVEVGNVSLNEGLWKVTLWRLPYTPGNHATFQISPDGKVVRVVFGTAGPEIGEDEAVAIAKKELSHWKKIVVGGASLNEGVWYVMLLRLPPVPGGHASVEILADGKVVRVLAGY